MPPRRLLLCLLAQAVLCALALLGTEIDVRSTGAQGDGRTDDTAAIRRAIELAGARGGGTVRFPAGRYVCGSLRLHSNLELRLEAGCVLEASLDPHAYDPPEPNVYGDTHQYQDFGHRHWQNSLIWGDGLENISITGPGLIDGKGLAAGVLNDNATRPHPNKAIALKNCRNVTLADFSLRHGGWFAILATGVDNFTLRGLRIDTNRDGIDLDCCRNVRVSDCTINAPNDDALCLKSSYALDRAQATENVTITNCQVSGYDEGTLLDGTFRRTHRFRDGPTGRIKFGTESNGGFKNITIANCVFDYSRGLALEIVDGGVMEDVTITGLTMRDIVNAPVFITLGSRLRGPAGTTHGTVRRVMISHLVASNVSAEAGILIVGVPEKSVEDITLSHVRIQYAGGGTAEQARRVVPERGREYPEPVFYGVLPAYGLYARHVRGLRADHLDFSVAQPDARPAFSLHEVADAVFTSCNLPAATSVIFTLSGATSLETQHVSRTPDGVHQP